MKKQTRKPAKVVKKASRKAAKKLVKKVAKAGSALEKRIQLLEDIEEITKLKSALADKTVENDFFRLALLRIKERRQRSDETGGSASTRSSNRGRKTKAR